MEWIDGNIGSKVTMKYPAVYLMGEHAKGEVLSIAFAGEGQHQDAGAKMVHAAPNTSSTIVSKSVAAAAAVPSYRGLVRSARAPTAPSPRQVRRAAGRHDLPLGHLPVRRHPRGRRVDGPRGDRLQGQRRPALLPDEPRLTEDEAMAMIVRGFIEPIAKELPMEYALELNRLIELQMEGRSAETPFRQQANSDAGKRADRQPWLRLRVFRWTR
jgi:Fe-S cluster assembly protein SufB